jgi:alkylation response protein AidB-like acyl-CoA dehydrogenase
VSRPSPFADRVRADLAARLEREPHGFRVEAAEVRRSLTASGKKCTTESVQCVGRTGITLDGGVAVLYARGWFDVRVNR